MKIFIPVNIFQGDSIFVDLFVSYPGTNHLVNLPSVIQHTHIWPTTNVTVQCVYGQGICYVLYAESICIHIISIIIIIKYILAHSFAK